MGKHGKKGQRAQREAGTSLDSIPSFQVNKVAVRSTRAQEITFFVLAARDKSPPESAAGVQSGYRGGERPSSSYVSLQSAFHPSRMYLFLTSPVLFTCLLCWCSPVSNELKHPDPWPWTSLNSRASPTDFRRPPEPSSSRIQVPNCCS